MELYPRALAKTTAVIRTSVDSKTEVQNAWWPNLVLKKPRSHLAICHRRPISMTVKSSQNCIRLNGVTATVPLHPIFRETDSSEVFSWLASANLRLPLKKIQCCYLDTWILWTGICPDWRMLWKWILSETTEELAMIWRNWIKTKLGFSQTFSLVLSCSSSESNPHASFVKKLAFVCFTGR